MKERQQAFEGEREQGFLQGLRELDRKFQCDLIPVTTIKGGKVIQNLEIRARKL